MEQEEQWDYICLLKDNNFYGEFCSQQELASGTKMKQRHLQTKRKGQMVHQHAHVRQDTKGIRQAEDNNSSRTAET